MRTVPDGGQTRRPHGEATEGASAAPTRRTTHGSPDRPPSEPDRPLQERVGRERAAWDAATALADPATRVLEVVGDRAPVLDEESGTPVLSWRAPRAGDLDAEFVILLGRGGDVDHPDRVDHPARVDAATEGPALVAIGRPGLDRSSGDHDARRTDRAERRDRPGADPDGRAEPVWRTLREVGPWMPSGDVGWWMTAQGLLLWHRTHRFCPRCGAATRVASAGWTRVCTNDGRENYPRTDPAVIMGIRDADDRLLLARSPQWPEGRRSVLAGFVEPGESLEDAVRREVAEEVGVRVGRVEYHGSQPWPFPASLMLGFAGWVDDPGLEIDPGEIAEAQWYTRAEVGAGVAAGSLMLPGRMSIARRLIEAWYGEALFVPGVDELGGPAWHRPT
ncbi:NAD(+) diphosphatase [Mobilicoccus sp.]|uniref:NAD(+) diphosphatase n=1 Tax=Mobilicoccus sp. TaxID=2034349 RepID=UPI0028A7C352|nr:NAD(+) diphosphatase [Mobilicoccus sp.]